MPLSPGRRFSILLPRNCSRSHCQLSCGAEPKLWGTGLHALENLSLG
jgi:hypothetical protein